MLSWLLLIIALEIPTPTPSPEIIETASQVQQITFWDTVLASVIAGATAGVLIVVMQVFGDYFLNRYLKWADTRANRLVRFPHEERIIDEKVFTELSPGRSIEYMKHVLGAPTQTYKERETLFPTAFFMDPETYEEIEFKDDDEKQKYSEKYHTTTAYVYALKNALIKITSKDREVIDSLAIEAREGVRLKVPQLPLGWDNDDELILNQTKVTAKLVEDGFRFHTDSSRYESIVAVCLYTAAPTYEYYTYFGSQDVDISPDENNPETFVGNTITGVCLHGEQDLSYIVRHWDYE